MVERRDVLGQIEEVARSLAQPEIPVRARPRERSGDPETAEPFIAAARLVQGLPGRDRNRDHARGAGRQRDRRADKGIDAAAGLGGTLDAAALRHGLGARSVVRSSRGDSPQRNARAVHRFHVDEDEPPRGVVEDAARRSLPERGLVGLAGGEPQIVVEEEPQVAETLRVVRDLDAADHEPEGDVDERLDPELELKLRGDEGKADDRRVAALDGTGLEGLRDPVRFSVDGDPDSGGAAEDLVLGCHRGRVELAEGAVAVSSGENASVPDDVCARQRDLLRMERLGRSGLGTLAEASALGQPSQVMH